MQGVNDFDLTAFADSGVNITGLRMVDASNKTVRDFILERKKHHTNNLSLIHI